MATAEELCARRCTLASCRKQTCIVFEKRGEGERPECHCGWTAAPDCPRHSGEGDQPAGPHEFEGAPGTSMFCQHHVGDGVYCWTHRDDPIHSGEGDQPAEGNQWHACPGLPRCAHPIHRGETDR